LHVPRKTVTLNVNGQVMNDNKRILITNLILDMLVDDTEPACLILKEVPEIDDELRKRFHDPFSSIKITKHETYNVLEELYKQGYVECTLIDLKSIYTGDFEDISFEKDNWEVWFRMTAKGKTKLEETLDIVWKD